MSLKLVFSTLICAASFPHSGGGWSESTRFALLYLAIQSDQAEAFNTAYRSLRAPKHTAKLFEALRARVVRAPHNTQHSIIHSLPDYPQRLRFATGALCTIAGDSTVSEYNRIAAMRVIGASGVRDRAVMDTLYRCMNEKLPDPNDLPKPPGVIFIVGPGENASIRCAAGVAIWKLDKQTAAFVPHLLKLLDCKWSRDRMPAIVAIGTIGADLKPVFGTRIVELLESDDQDTREAVMKLLPVFAPSRGVAAELLTKNMIRSGEKHSKFCEDYHAGRTKLTFERFADASRFMASEQVLAKNTLAGMGADALPEVTRLLVSKEAGHRATGLNTLRLMRHHGKLADALKAVPEIEKLLNDPDPTVKSLAETTLKELREKK